MGKKKTIRILIDIQPELMDEIKESAKKNSEGVVNREIRRLINKAIQHDRVCKI